MTIIRINRSLECGSATNIFKPMLLTLSWVSTLIRTVKRLAGMDSRQNNLRDEVGTCSPERKGKKKKRKKKDRAYREVWGTVRNQNELHLKKGI